MAINKDVICKDCEGRGGPADAFITCKECDGSGVKVMVSLAEFTPACRLETKKSNACSITFLGLPGCILAA